MTGREARALRAQIRREKEERREKILDCVGLVLAILLLMVWGCI